MFGKRVGRVGGVGNVGGSRKGPSFALDFINGLSSGDPRLTTVRAAGGATNFNSNGNLVLSAANSQRVDYEVVRQQLANTNLLFSGSSANVFSTDVPPLFAGTPVQKSVMTQSGVDTNCGSSSATLLTSVPAVVSLYVWIPSAYTGSLMALFLTGTGTSLPSSTASLVLRDQWQRISISGAAASSGATNIVLRSTSANGQVFYHTGWQMEYGSTASAYQPATGGVVTTAGRGLSVEEARTNSITNPRAEGALPGTPGTPPTSWFVSSNAAGLTSTIVGSGTESGIPYLDWQVSGTTTASGSMSLSFEQNTTMTAAQNQVWTASVYARLVAGSLAGIGNTALLDLTERDISGNPLSDHVTNIFASLTAAPLATQRYGVAGATLSNASTAFVGFNLFLNSIPNSSTVSFTIRIGAPQVELGAFVTSAILPAVGTPLATTRATELFSMAWTGTATYSMIVEANLPQLEVASLMSVDDGTPANRCILATTLNGTATAQILSVTGATNATDTTVNVYTAGTTFKLGVAHGVNFDAALKGGTIAALSTIPQPVGINTLRFGRNVSGSAQMNGYIRKARYWPRALSDAELQVQTT